MLIKQQLNLKEVRLFRDDGSAIAINDLSSGESSLLLKSVALACTVEDNSLILIDEPENSLHPAWQGRFIEDLRVSLESVRDCHVIISTHSPHLISAFEPENGSVVAMSRDGNEVRGRPMSYVPYGWSLENVLLECFETATPRNYYFEMKIRELLSQMEKRDRNPALVGELIQSLEKFQLDRNDPLRVLLDRAKAMVN